MSQSRTRGTLVAVLIFSALALFSAMSTVAPAVITVDKSPNDKREYRAIVLENGMRVLLVSDPASERAAAAVNVAAGSNSDPEDFNGLAHFLEHMLFLGTEKYPASGEYQEFIASHGGSHNAYTAYENTNYYFEIDANYLEPGLDRFSQFFIAPLFTADYVNRERNAVNSEYQSGLQDDGRRSQAVLKAIINPEHPMSQFSVGSLDTLQDHGNKTLRNALLEHYERYYSANLMSVAIFGKESPDQLEAWARKYFSAVENRHRAKPSSNVPLFNPGSLPLQVNIEPIRDARALSYSFPIPDMRKRYREKPVDYLANVLGHEGEGSLLKVLRDRGWANALSAGGGIATDDINIFNINVALTEEGLSHVDDITALLFQFIDLINREGVNDWQYEELATMSAIAFQYQEPSGAVGFVTNVAARMQDLPLQDLITAAYAFEDFDADMIRDVLSYLRPDNMLLMLSAPALDADNTEQWYGTRYGEQPIPQTRIGLWQQYPQDETLAISAPNPFIPENLALKPLEGEPMAPDAANVQEKPELLVNADGVRLWFKQDNEFFTPRTNFYVYALTPVFQNSLRNSLLSNFAVTLVN
ncbi:MAG: insulinase family protein, partial [Pseudomonadota bacterium]